MSASPNGHFPRSFYAQPAVPMRKYPCTDNRRIPQSEKYWVRNGGRETALESSACDECQRLPRQVIRGRDGAPRGGRAARTGVTRPRARAPARRTTPSLRSHGVSNLSDRSQPLYILSPSPPALTSSVPHRATSELMDAPCGMAQVLTAVHAPPALKFCFCSAPCDPPHALNLLPPASFSVDLRDLR